MWFAQLRQQSLVAQICFVNFPFLMLNVCHRFSLLRFVNIRKTLFNLSRLTCCCGVWSQLRLWSFRVHAADWRKSENQKSKSSFELSTYTHTHDGTMTMLVPLHMSRKILNLWQIDGNIFSSFANVFFAHFVGISMGYVCFSSSQSKLKLIHWRRWMRWKMKMPQRSFIFVRITESLFFAICHKLQYLLNILKALVRIHHSATDDKVDEKSNLFDNLCKMKYHTHHEEHPHNFQNFQFRMELEYTAHIETKRKFSVRRMIKNKSIINSSKMLIGSASREWATVSWLKSN